MVMVILQNNIMNNSWILKVGVWSGSCCIYPDSTSGRDLSPTQPIALFP